MVRADVSVPLPDNYQWMHEQPPKHYPIDNHYQNGCFGFIVTKIFWRRREFLISRFEFQHHSRVCSCFGVGRNTICAAIKKHGLTTPQQIGQKLKAGTNCGSCIPELKTILLEEQAQGAA